MKNIVKGFIMMLLLVATTSLAAQKYGHINSGLLLPDLPEWQSAQTEMETLKTQLENQYKQQVEQFQQEVKLLQERVDVTKNITEIELQSEQQRLAKVEQELAEFEKTAQLKLLEKEQALVEPLLARIQNAIKTVAEENGYTYIFDLGVQGMIVFAVPEGDVTELVKAKL